MQKVYFILFIAFFSMSIQSSYPQSTDSFAAEFDVIVLNNGSIIHGKVVEVGLQLIRYKRTDIPDGPIYELEKSKVFAISYRNQLTEYMDPQSEEAFADQGSSAISDSTDLKDPDLGNDLWHSSIDSGDLRLGFGFIRNFSRVKEVEDYQSEFSFPSVHISYLFPVNENIDLGMAVAFAGFKYQDKSFSEYDQLMTDRTINESLFSIALVGRYWVDMDLLRPYFLTGISYTNSSVRTEGSVAFSDDERSILVHGGARSGNFGIPLRGGVDIRISEPVNVFLEVGTGLSLLQVGAVFKMGR